MKTKLCRKCGVVKPFSDFYKQSDNSTGIASQCKICANRRVKDWTVQNEDKRLQICKRYYGKNKDNWWIFVHLRRSRCDGAMSKERPSNLLVLQKYKCAACKVDLRKSGYEIDHIDAISQGGSNDDRNIQLLCRKCNRAKSTKNSVEFMQSKGYLL